MSNPQAVTISTTKGKWTVTPVRVAGNLALHAAHNTDEEAWSITHIPTGYAACTVRTKQIAEMIFDRFETLDWNFRSFRSPKRRAMTPIVQKIKQEITGSARTVQVE